MTFCSGMKRYFERKSSNLVAFNNRLIRLGKMVDGCSKIYIIKLTCNPKRKIGKDFLPIFKWEGIGSCYCPGSLVNHTGKDYSGSVELLINKSGFERHCVK